MRINVDMNTELERKFRETAMKRFGYKQGALKKGIEEAIQDWLNKEQ